MEILVYLFYFYLSPCNKFLIVLEYHFLKDTAAELDKMIGVFLFAQT